MKRVGATDFQHSVIGRLALAKEVLSHASESQRLMVYQAAPGASEHEALFLLAMAAESANPAVRLH